MRFGYQPPPSGFDEALGSAGEPRPHWHAFFRSIADLGESELVSRWQDARQLIRENGVTYNVYGDPRGMDAAVGARPDPAAHRPGRGRGPRAGLVQRGLLLERILADLYGPQRPAARRAACRPNWSSPTPASCGPVTASTLPGGRHLHLYAADLGRQAGRRVRVLGDRTQAPSGAGYALENRIVLSRMLPEAFRDCRVQRLALFFRALPRRPAGHRPAATATTRGSSCSPPGRTTRPTSSTPTWPATSATRWSRAAT